MELFETERIGSDMKRDGRTLDGASLETIRLMAIERVREGEAPAEVMASFGFNRTTIYKWLKAALQPGVGIKGVAVDEGHGAPANPDCCPRAAGISLGQRARPATVWPGLRFVDAKGGG